MVYFLTGSCCLEVFARRRVTLMVEVSSSLVPGPACVCCHKFPCPSLLPCGCSQVSVSISLQPAQAQLPEALVCWADTPWVGQVFLTDTGTDLAQAGQARGSWSWGRSWNLPSSGQGKARPVQNLGHFAWNEKNPYLCSNKELQPRQLFLDIFFFPLLCSFLLLHVFILLKWSRAWQNWIMLCVIGWGNILFSFQFNTSC